MPSRSTLSVARNALIALVAAGALVSVAAAAPGVSERGQANSVSLAAATSSTGTLPLYTAWKLGYFTQAGVNVDFKPVQDSSARANALIGHQVDFVLDPPDGYLSPAAQGIGIKMMMAELNLNILELVVAPDITSIDQLKGKTGATFFVGHTISNVGDLVLKQQGLKPNVDYKWVAVGNTAGVTAAMQKGIAQFTFASPVNVAQFQALGFHVLKYKFKKIVYPTLGIITRPDVLKANPGAASKLVLAIGKAVHYLKVNRAAGVRLLMQMSNITDQSVATQGYNAYIIPNVSADCFSLTGLKNVKAALLSAQPAIKSLDVSTLINNNAVRAAAKQSSFVHTRYCPRVPKKK